MDAASRHPSFLANNNTSLFSPSRERDWSQLAVTLSPVNKAYRNQMPFAFTGKIDYVRFDFDDDGIELTPQQQHDLKKAMD
jgi:hypothetical protein